MLEAVGRSAYPAAWCRILSGIPWIQNFTIMIIPSVSGQRLLQICLVCVIEFMDHEIRISEGAAGLELLLEEQKRNFLRQTQQQCRRSSGSSCT